MSGEVGSAWDELLKAWPVIGSLALFIGAVSNFIFNRMNRETKDTSALKQVVQTVAEQGEIIRDLVTIKTQTQEQMKQLVEADQRSVKEVDALESRVNGIDRQVGALEAVSRYHRGN